MYARVRLVTNLNQHFICTQEGFDTDVADVMITWIRESIAPHVDASRICVDNSKKSLQIKGLLATLVDFVTRRHGGATCYADAMEGVRKTVRASMLCLDVTRECINRAESVGIRSPSVSNCKEAAAIGCHKAYYVYVYACMRVRMYM